MRYAHGLLIGAILPGIAFLGAIFPKVAGIGVTDPQVLAEIWNLYLLWFFISVIIAVIPLLVVRQKYPESYLEFRLFEVGGFALFSPLWLFVATEFSGDSWLDIIFLGLDGALPAPGPNGTIIGVSVEPFLLVPLLLLGIISGLVILRPSFIKTHGQAAPRARRARVDETDAPEETPAAVLDRDLPGVAPPVADETSKNELKDLLIEIGTPEPFVTAILNAGFATVTDVVSTSTEQLAIATGLDKTTAENIHMSIQKKVWFGGI
ncbi:MAG: helix-hairpin-helix domain-containing protein [Candidatus Hodarchaeota archaeon]